MKKHDRLILVLCGSVSSWIKEHIVNSAAFVGRRSCDLVVRELPLKECVKFWGREVERIDLKEIVDVLSVTGGVPRYLEENRMLPNDVAKMAEAYGGRAAECRARHVPRARRLCPRPWAVDRAAMENESCAKKLALRGI